MKKYLKRKGNSRATICYFVTLENEKYEEEGKIAYAIICFMEKELQSLCLAVSGNFCGALHVYHRDCLYV